MIKNIGTTDRLIRLILGIFLSIASLVTKSPILGIFGLLTLYESLANWCIFYQLIGRNTCPLPKSDPAGNLDFKAYYLSGLAILIVAIGLNYLAVYLGWSTWYTLLMAPGNLTQISLDNWLFLLIFYPITLAVAGISIFKKSHAE